MPARTPTDRALIAAIASHESWALTADRTARTAPARAALDQKFLDEAEGDPVRAAHLRRAYYYRLALKSAQARRKVRENIEATRAAEAELRVGRARMIPARRGAPPGKVRPRWISPGTRGRRRCGQLVNVYVTRAARHSTLRTVCTAPCPGLAGSGVVRPMRSRPRRRPGPSPCRRVETAAA